MIGMKHEIYQAECSNKNTIVVNFFYFIVEQNMIFFEQTVSLFVQHIMFLHFSSDLEKF